MSASGLRRSALVSVLYGLQAGARLVGRLEKGLFPGRYTTVAPGLSATGLPRSKQMAFWCESWASAEDRLEALETLLAEAGASVHRGGSFDRWDLEVWDGPFGTARFMMAIEEHGHGAQLVRLRTWPRLSRLGTALAGGFAVGGGLLALTDGWLVGVLLGGLALLVAVGAIRDCNLAQDRIRQACRDYLGDPIE